MKIFVEKTNKKEMPLTSAMACHDIHDTAGNFGETLTDISCFKTGLPKQFLTLTKSFVDGGNSKARCFQFAWFQQCPSWNIHKP